MACSVSACRQPGKRKNTSEGTLTARGGHNMLMYVITVGKTYNGKSAETCEQQLY